ncbi:hypothetical protein PAHAL_9G343000 [Panicum hallii]|uniref:Uncharacterized protein n=1 Tax=Panicum hallii TaxID=206008 RepID=A0A2T8I3E4_9POAL|nr:hypothetical protein PAHAL_9G343000 [Panicum hallii]PVH32194.1 hypothetical protein PAHAL_9G343000 [Panicum hallii]PVH32195.1 hypothetical protein PAHAL_9G343000 [Panicum hallii]
MTVPTTGGGCEGNEMGCERRGRPGSTPAGGTARPGLCTSGHEPALLHKPINPPRVRAQDGIQIGRAEEIRSEGSLPTYDSLWLLVNQCSATAVAVLRHCGGAERWWHGPSPNHKAGARPG